jgi:chitinase
MTLIGSLQARTALCALLVAIASGCAGSGAPDENGEPISVACPASVPAWAVGATYSTGSLVSYQGTVYRCVQGHTTVDGWYPPIVPALWEPVTCTSGNTGNNGGSPDMSMPPTQKPPADMAMPPADMTKPTNPPPPPPTGSLPKHVLTGYWQNFNNGAKVLTLKDVPATYDLIAVAFADADPTRPGAVTFTLDGGLNGYTEAGFISDIGTLHQQGRKVIISVGGQNGTISVADPTSASNFANSVYTLVQKYGFDGVDIDLENGVNPTYMASALKQLSSKVGAGLVITLAPQTIDMQSTGGGYFQLALAIKDILTIVNMQYYNSGSMLGADQKVYSQGGVDFLTALAAIQLQNGLRPDQVGIGLPASPSGAGSGYVAPSVVNAAVDCLANGTSCGSYHPPAKWSVRGAMDWSINWDASAGYSFANTVRPHLGTLP